MENFGGKDEAVKKTRAEAMALSTRQKGKLTCRAEGKVWHNDDRERAELTVCDDANEPVWGVMPGILRPLR